MSRTVVVTGASTGIGRATALLLAQEGAHVSICARGREALEATADELRALGVKVHAQTCDLGKPDEIDAFLEAAYTSLGRVDALVNNASALSMGDQEVDWRANFEVDVLGCVRASQKVIPWLREQGELR